MASTLFDRFSQERFRTSARRVQPRIADRAPGPHHTTVPEKNRQTELDIAASNQICLDPFTIARTLGAVAFLLILACIGGHLFKYFLGHDHVYRLLFDVNVEKNIPTLFSAFQLFCAASLLTVITVLKKKEKDPDASKWAILAFGFLFMTVDEWWSLHERLINPVREFLGDGALDIFFFAWVVPGIAVVFVLLLFFLRFLLRLPARTRFTFIVAGTLFVGGAIGIELLGGRYAKLYGQENLTYGMLTTLEESLEMVGVTVFIYALLKYIADNYNEVRFQFENLKGNSRSKAPKAGLFG